MSLKALFLPFTLLCATVVTATASAQQDHPERAAVMKTVEQFFAGINTADTDLMAKVSLDGASVYSIAEQEDGHFQMRFRQRDRNQPQAIQPGYTERYWDETVLVDNQVAVFWAPYDFYIDRAFSHCGTDVFNLIKVDSEWKIASAMWTIQRTGCPPSPLGPLKAD